MATRFASHSREQRNRRQAVRQDGLVPLEGVETQPRTTPARRQVEARLCSSHETPRRAQWKNTPWKKRNAVCLESNNDQSEEEAAAGLCSRRAGAEQQCQERFERGFGKRQQESREHKPPWLLRSRSSVRMSGFTMNPNRVAFESWHHRTRIVV